jgi:hypothetical protein
MNNSMLLQPPSPELYQVGEEYQLGELIGVYKRYVTLLGTLRINKKWHGLERRSRSNPCHFLFIRKVLELSSKKTRVELQALA